LYVLFRRKIFFGTVKYILFILFHRRPEIVQQQ
jgi:hypothetical protein